MANLYEIDERLQALEQYLIDIETGEIVETENQFNELYDSIKMDLDTKIENTMCFYKNLLSDANQIKQEEQALAKRRKTKEHLAERLKERVNKFIYNKFTDENGNVNKEGLNKFKFETSKVKLSYRKSITVNVDSVEKLSKDYLTIETTVKPDKVKIKNAIKNGIDVEGATLETNINMQVK